MSFPGHSFTFFRAGTGTCFIINASSALIARALDNVKHAESDDNC